MTRQRAGSRSSSTTSAAWARTGPLRAASSRPLAEVRKVTAWPVAGASTTMRSATRSRSSCLTLPSTRTSRMPGMAVATTSTTPERDQPLGDPLRPWSARYSSSASSGVIRRARTVPPPGRRRCRAAEDRLVVVEAARCRRRPRPMPGRPSSSTRSTDSPASAAMRARAAATVVLPTPPLPATTRTRLSAQKAATSIRRRA